MSLDELPGLVRAATNGDPLDVDPRSTPGLRREPADHETDALHARLQNLQERLWAAGRRGASDAVLVVVQGMDASGKGGAISRLVRLFDPTGVHHKAFGAPTARERAHDFLWRIRPHLPEPGGLSVFDRSHYEDVLVPMARDGMHPLDGDERLERIREFEAEAVATGTRIVKAMLLISRDEQQDRLLARLDDPRKRWKFQPGDVDDRMRWAAFHDVYRRAIRATDTDASPWFVVPADHKWYARVALQQLALAAFEAIDPHWPAPSYDVDEQRRRVRAS